MTRRLSKLHGTVSAALALAAHYFPTRLDDGRTAGSFHHASYLLSGHLDMWSQWRDMPVEDKQRIAALTGFTPEELANPATFATRARALLRADDDEEMAFPFRAYTEAVGAATSAIPQVGGDLLGYADRILERLRKDHRRRSPRKPAEPGLWRTKTAYAPAVGNIEGTAAIPAFGDGDEITRALPTLVTTPYLPHVDVTTHELLDLAHQVDQRYPSQQRYLHDVLKGLLDQLSTSDTLAPTDLLRLVAGPTEVFNAPTGTGKSVLVRVAALWFAVHGMTITLVVPTVEATLAAAWEITEDLRFLGRPETCTALMSPHRLLERATKAAARLQGSLFEQNDKTLWKLEQMSYGCALAHHTEATAPYPDGQESCHQLLPLSPRTDTRECPWKATCGKYEQQRQACTASVIVTNHHNFMAGRMHIGINLDGRNVGDLSVAELALRRSHAVLIDEIDQFQSTAVDMCTSDLVLASRRPVKVPLQELDRDISTQPAESIKDLCPTISHARYLAEFMLASICESQIHLRHYAGRQAATEDGPGINSTSWHLVGSRDRRLLSLLFPDEDIADDKEIPAEMFDRLNALRPSPPTNAATADRVELPAPLNTIRNILEKVLAPRGEDLLAHVQLELDEALSDTVKDPHERAEAAELLIVRTWLAELDDALDLLRQKTTQLRAAGMDSARKVAESLGSSIGSRILPYGMLGRAIIGYRVTGLDEPDKSAELTAQSVTGDPHTYTAQLGSIVSLVLAGVERPVMGLSATAYFPQAVREHIHSEVKWWMTDAAPDSIRARRRTVTVLTEPDSPIQISGLPQALKKNALMTLGDRLYDTEIHHELERIRQTAPERAHAAIVVNSYEHCRYLAMGIYSAGRYTGGLCVAVPGDKERRDKLPPLPPGITELTPEEFEDFPQQGTMLVVPMARIARGLNIVIGTQSAITPVYLCTRPLALMSDAAEMYASVNVAGLRALPAQPTADPVQALQLAREAAWKRLGVIMRSAAGFINTSPELQEEIVAGMVVDMVQLAGRARRGGTDMTLYLVDHAFHEDAWQADLANILRRMHGAWHPDVRRRMNDIYREALAAFLAYAGITTTGQS
ncbi:hypothetical protein AB0L88_06115 [Saccharopolyspora shandongensis]|uniref:hypothetical protein n=1 Tax=Saccharopolyspora shandongensis TaxID=418495 RepID=UPI003427ED1E